MNKVLADFAYHSIGNNITVLWAIDADRLFSTFFYYCPDLASFCFVISDRQYRVNQCDSRTSTEGRVGMHTFFFFNKRGEKTHQGWTSTRNHVGLRVEVQLKC